MGFYACRAVLSRPEQSELPSRTSYSIIDSRRVMHQLKVLRRLDVFVYCLEAGIDDLPDTVRGEVQVIKLLCSHVNGWFVAFMSSNIFIDACGLQNESGAHGHSPPWAWLLRCLVFRDRRSSCGWRRLDGLPILLPRLRASRGLSYGWAPIPANFMTTYDLEVTTDVLRVKVELSVRCVWILLLVEQPERLR